LRLFQIKAALPGLAIACTGLALAWAAYAAVPGEAPEIGAGCADPQAQCIDLAAVSLEGVTAYDLAQFVPYYQDYLTREVGLADLTAIAAAITERYRQDGYFLSRAVVPPQLRGGHMARIQIYEGYVGEVSVTGAGAAAATPTLQAIAGKTPLRLADLDRALALAGDTPGIKLKSHLEPVLDDPARHHLVVEATTDKVELSAYADNRGPHSAGPWQTYLRGAVNSALVAGDQASLAVLTVPFDIKSFAYGELAYALPVGKAGDRLRAAFSLAKAKDGANAISQDVGSDSWSANLSWLHPLWRSRRVNSFAQLTLNARQVEQDWTGGGQYKDEVVALRGMISATVLDQGQSTNVWAQVSAGQRGDSAAQLSRPDASRQFTKINAHAAHYRDLSKHTGLYLSADGQYSKDRLLASEELIVGGAPYGRGYSYAAIGGDRGLVGTAELRAGFKPKNKLLSFVQGYGFFDAGKVWNRGLPATELASAGAGLRLRVGDKTTLGLEAAKPLKKVPFEKDTGWKPYMYLSTVF
jgi:hemolysin activation/secretion protein